MTPPLPLEVDFSAPQGAVRPLHGVNFGPICFNGLFDFSREMAALHTPCTRLHDCQYAVPGAVDIHGIFPLFHADHNDPGNYVFPVTDDYLQSIVDIGSKIVYRLGETIEHYRRRKYCIHPPPDVDKWAEICRNIVRHYNDGWAQGFHHDIAYWEIWNEPWHGLCWQGTPEQFFRMYAAVARVLKEHDPRLRVGAGFEMTTDFGWKFTSAFLAFIRQEGLPYDFCAVHPYPDQPRELATYVRAVRARLDELGFAHTEIHVNEWAMNPGSPEIRYLFHPRQWGPIDVPLIQGSVGAAGVATLLAWFQDLPIAMANYYWAREGIWGLFDQYARPTKPYYAFLAFSRLQQLGQRVAASGSNEEHGVGVLAAYDTNTATGVVLVANHGFTGGDFSLALRGFPGSSRVRIKKAVIDEGHDLEFVSQRVASEAAATVERVPAGSVALFVVTPEGSAVPGGSPPGQ